jgi:hypothetical protein
LPGSAIRAFAAVAEQQPARPSVFAGLIAVETIADEQAAWSDQTQERRAHPRHRRA